MVSLISFSIRLKSLKKWREEAIEGAEKKKN